MPDQWDEEHERKNGRLESVMKKILIPQPVAKAGEKMLLDAGYKIIRSGTKVCELAEAVADCDAILARICPYPSQVIQAGKKLRIIARHGAGFDNVDIQAATRQDIWVTNVPDVTSVSVAEFTIGMILNGMRRISECHEELSAGNYAYRYSHPGRDLFGKTLGIIGLGRIGQAVAQRAYFGFGMKILAYVPRQEGKTIPDYVKIVEKEELLANSDVISIHVPGNESNRHLIGKRELKIMRADSYLVNVSRGGVVDEAALAETLHNGKIAGAALDVWMDEPKLPADELLSCKNLFLTPHIGSGSAECMDRMAMEAAGEILRVLSGSEPKHPVNLL